MVFTIKYGGFRFEFSLKTVNQSIDWAFPILFGKKTPQDDVEDVEFQLELPSSTVLHRCAFPLLRLGNARDLGISASLHSSLSSLAMANPP